MSNSTEKLFSEFPPVSVEQWKEKIIKDLKGKDYSTLINRTEFGLDFEPFYTEEKLQEIEATGNYPGVFPYVRGTKNNNSWIISQSVFVNNFANANKEALKLLSAGVEEIAFVLQGNNIKSYDELAELLQNIDLEQNILSFRKQENVLLLQELFISYIEKNNYDKTKIKGSFNYTPLACYVVHGRFPFEENSKLEILQKALAVNKKELPQYSLVNIAGVPFYNAGADTVQEIAFTLSQAVEYLNIISNNDNNLLNEFIKQAEFTISTGSDYFVEIAKIRVFRWLWAKIVEQYNVKDADLQKIKINSVSGFRNKTVYDPYVNMLRVTTETMSAAVAGVKSITVLPFDATFKMPDEFSYRIAKNVQILLKEESYFNKIVDPAGGSYYIETLTKEIAAKAWQLFLDIEEKGGYLKAVENNFIQNEIEKSALKRKEKISTGKHGILGTNKYPNPDEFVKDKLEKNIFSDKSNNANFKLLKPFRDSEDFEKLRLSIEESDKKPKVFLFTYGNLAMRKARAMFSSNFFAVAGFEVIDNPGFSSIEEGSKEIEKHNPDIVVACSSDDEYKDMVPQLKILLPESIRLVVAGYPKDLIDDFAKIGVNDFIHVKSNILNELTKFKNDILK